MTPSPLPIDAPLAENWRGFFTGINAFFAGLKLVAPGGGLFRYALAPALLSLLVLLGGVLLGWFLLHGWISEWIAQQGWASWLGWLGSALVFVLALLLAYFLFMPVMALLAPLFIDPIVERVYERYTGRPLVPPQTRSFMRRQMGAFVLSAKLMVVGLVIELPLALLALFTGVGAIIAVPIRGWLQGGDLLDNPLGMRHLRVRERYGLFWRWRWSVTGLGAACDLAMLVPVLNLLVLAAGAAGATLLLISSEQAAPSAEAPAQAVTTGNEPASM